MSGKIINVHGGKRLGSIGQQNKNDLSSTKSFCAKSNQTSTILLSHHKMVLFLKLTLSCWCVCVWGGSYRPCLLSFNVADLSCHFLCNWPCFVALVRQRYPRSQETIGSSVGFRGSSTEVIVSVPDGVFTKVRSSSSHRHGRQRIRSPVGSLTVN